MSDVKKEEKTKEIQDEKLDKVSGGMFDPYPHPHPTPAPDPHPSPRPKIEPRPA